MYNGFTVTQFLQVLKSRKLSSGFAVGFTVTQFLQVLKYNP